MIRSEHIMRLGATVRTEIAEAHAEIREGPPPAPASASRPDVVPGAAAESPGHTRRARLALAPPVRAKLERIEAQAAAAHAEVLRLGDLLADERDRRIELDRREQSWKANHFHRVIQADLDRLAADRGASANEIAGLTAQRDAAQLRWQRLSRVAENCRMYLGLPADGRRN